MSAASLRKFLVLLPLMWVVAGVPRAGAAGTINFAAARYYPTGDAGQTSSIDENGTATGDFLGNGRRDVVCVCVWQGNTIRIMHNNGDGTFQTPGQQITVGSSDENVVTGIFTNSGRTDIVVLGASGWWVLVNDGLGKFRLAASYSLQQAPFQDSAVVADFLHNGKQDIAIKTPSGIQMEFPNGDGTFRPGPLSSVPGSASGGVDSLAVANLNGDAIPDLVLSDGGSQSVFAMKGNGDGSFTETGSAVAPFVPGSVAAADINHDGLDDAVALDEFNMPGASAALFLNNGRGGWTANGTYDGGFNPVSAAVGNFNGAGPDVVSSDTTGGQQVILAPNGGGGLVTAGKFATGFNSQSPSVADLNGDGKPDIAVSTNCPSSFNGAQCIAVLINTST
jgi:hypothetical protein